MERKPWQRQKCAALLVELSKTFDFLQYNLLLAKLNVIKQFRIFYLIENTEQKLIHPFNNWEDLFIVVLHLSTFVI